MARYQPRHESSRTDSPEDRATGTSAVASGTDGHVSGMADRRGRRRIMASVALALAVAVMLPSGIAIAWHGLAKPAATATVAAVASSAHSAGPVPSLMDGTSVPSATPSSSSTASPSPTASHPSTFATSGSPSPSTVPATMTTARARELARQAVSSMSLEERAGQLVMATLTVGSSAQSLKHLIADEHVGSVLLIGNWRTGTNGVASVVSALQSYADTGSGGSLIIATDQEGGQVQHLKGSGFDAMPSARSQGTLSTAALRSAAARWGSQLASAGVNVDLAPVAGTVVGSRSANAPIGALDRDFGLDAAGNGSHAAAFIQGMRDAGVRTAVKHFPGLGAVNGNTDFTSSGVLDSTTTADGAEVQAFATAIAADPGMVMMSVATYAKIDPSAPAAFSSTVIDGLLRGSLGYDGAVISDSLSASALSGTATDQLGVRLIEAGGDLACMGAASYTQPVLDGIIAKAGTDSSFASHVEESAVRVMTLKYLMGLAKE